MVKLLLVTLFKLSSNNQRDGKKNKTDKNITGKLVNIDSMVITAIKGNRSLFGNKN